MFQDKQLTNVLKENRMNHLSVLMDSGTHSKVLLRTFFVVGFLPFPIFSILLVYISIISQPQN